MRARAWLIAMSCALALLLGAFACVTSPPQKDVTTAPPASSSTPAIEEPGALVWPLFHGKYAGVTEKGPRGRMGYALEFHDEGAAIHAESLPPTHGLFLNILKQTFSLNRAGAKSSLTMKTIRGNGVSITTTLALSAETTRNELVFCAGADDAGIEDAGAHGCEALEIRFRASGATHLRMKTRIRGKIHTDISLDPAGPDAGETDGSNEEEKPPAYSAWSDEAAITALAEDCHEGDDPDEYHRSRGPLSCTVFAEQSCVYDPCFEKTQTCRGECGSACGSCDDTCVQTCGACKKPCKDDACKRACAVTTGACKDACLKSFDHCATAGCSASASACGKNEISTWKKNHCSCARIYPCEKTCMDAKDHCSELCSKDKSADCYDKCDPAWDKCIGRCKSANPGCDITYCMMGGKPGWEYESP